MTEKKQIHILNLGAGVQSTALFLMSLDGDLDIVYDAAIFADTGDEPESVYVHLEREQRNLDEAMYSRI
jgi:hypothetical protein